MRYCQRMLDVGDARLACLSFMLLLREEVGAQNSRGIHIWHVVSRFINKVFNRFGQINILHHMIIPLLCVNSYGRRTAIMTPHLPMGLGIILKTAPQRTNLRRAKPWSISTTVRNPERLRDFLSVLSPLDGQVFDQQTQIKYQVLLIQAKFYRPIAIPSAFSQYYENLDIPMPYEKAEQLFHLQNYEDPPMRGRQSLNPLKKLGFVVISRDTGKIHITDLGKQFLSEDYDIGYIFFKSLLKLQFPNPISREFSAGQGFNLSPFVATLHVLMGVQEAGLEGLTRNEFSLFIPTLINAADIKAQVARIFAYRNSQNRQSFAEQYLRSFYNLDH